MIKANEEKPTTSETMTKVDASAIASCAKKIHAANDKFGKQFSQWIQTVGSELRTAQNLLANHGNGKFETWCREQFGWSKQRAYQLLDANMTFAALSSSTIVDDVKQLPSNEAQLRELNRLAEDDVAIVWESVVKDAEAEHKPITAKLVKEHVKKYQQIEDGGECDEADGGETVSCNRHPSGEFDIHTALIRLTDLIHGQLDLWPKEHLHLAAKWIRETLTEEYGQ